MIARIVILIFIALLALPIATLTPPGDPGRPSWSDVAVEAKGKKKSKKNKKPKTTTVTRTVRGPVTRTFTSTASITIPAGAPGVDNGPADPYPSAMVVSGLPNGVITDVDLIINDLTHDHHDDIDILLSTNDGRRALVMSDVGDLSDVADIDLTLDDEAAASLPVQGGALSSGTYRPANFIGFTVDTFAAPAPAPNGNVALSTFDGADPNGTWRLWVMDNNLGDDGDLGGWALHITAEVDVATVEEQVPSGKDAKQHKGKKGKKQGKGKRHRD